MNVTGSTNLKGLTAVVTGSSSGIGRAIARELAVAGAACLVHARRSKDAAEETARGLAELSVPICVELCDLSDTAAYADFVERAWRWRDGIDIWVNNAGADVLTGEPGRWPFERKLAELLRVDVEATVALSRAVGRRMKERGRGAIVNVGWDQAETGMAGDSGELFATSKGAVMAFTKSLARSLAPEVRVNCVAPGWIQTSWGHGASQYWQKRAQRESLLARWGQPEDVARVVRFLASEDAAFVTGHVLPVNGGLRQTE